MTARASLSKITWEQFPYQLQMYAVSRLKRVYNPNNKKAQLIHCISQEIKFMFHF